MTTGPITLRPGIDIVKTPLLNEGGFSDANLIRWFNGLAQKLGGCTRLTSATVSGLATALHPFSDLESNNYIGIGTSTSLQIYSANSQPKPGAVSNIALTNIAVVDRSSTVTITDANYSPEVGQTVNVVNAFTDASSGVFLQGNYTVQTVNSVAHTYTLTMNAPWPATAPKSVYQFLSVVGHSDVEMNITASFGPTVNIGIGVTLTGSGLTPTTISPGVYTAGTSSGSTFINYGSTTSATFGIGPISENGGNIQFAYQPFSDFAAGTINTIQITGSSNLPISAFAVVIGSPIVTITDTGYLPYAGQSITVKNALLSSAPAVFLQGNYTVTSVDELTNSYTIDAGLPWPNAGILATYQFLSVIGHADVEMNINASFGPTIKTAFPVTLASSGLTPTTIPAGTYTQGTGSGSSFINYGSTTNATAAIGPVDENGGNIGITYNAPAMFSGVWSLDNWGQNLIGAPQGGVIYSWTPPLPDPATVVSTGPLFNNVVFVAMPQQQMVSCGSDGGGFLDPLLVRWSDVSDYTSATAWTPLATNQAGSFRLSSGSLIIGALQGPQQGFIWTDVDMWVMQYIGFPLVYGFNRVGQACGLIAKRAVAQIGGALWWLGQKGAFYYDGASVKPLPCPVWDYFWNNVDQANLQSVFAAVNSDFNEIGWYFPTTTSAGVATNYIKLNVQISGQPAWDYGVLTRYAWCDRSVIGPAVGVDANNLLQQHETSNDLDGVAMDSFATTAWFKLAEGQDFITVKRIIWDSIISGTGAAEMLVTVYVANYPNDPPAIYGPYNVDNTTQYITVKARGRICRLKFESVDLGSFWRLGQPIFVISNTGRR